MFLGFIRARRRRAAAAESESAALTPESSGLDARQLETGARALRLLRLESRRNALSPGDLLDFLRAVGLNPSPDAVEAKLRALKLQRAAAFTWGQLSHVWAALLQDAAGEADILLRAFEFFDKDGNGELSVAELRSTMKELGGLLTEDEIAEFVEVMDADRSGAISYQEFVELLSQQGPAAAWADGGIAGSEAEQQAAGGGGSGVTAGGGGGPRMASALEPAAAGG